MKACTLKKRIWPIQFKTINAQLSFSFSLLIAMVISCQILAVSFLFSQSFIRQKSILMQNSLETISGTIESRMNNVRKLTQVMRNEASIRASFADGAVTLRASELLDSLYIFGLRSIVLIDTNGTVLNPVTAAPDSAGGGSMLERTGFSIYRLRNREESFSSPHAFPYENPSNDPLYNTRLSYFFCMREQPQYDEYGYVQINITRDSLFDENIAFIRSQFDSFYVIDEQGNLIYSTTGYMPDAMLETAITYSNRRYTPGSIRSGENYYFHYSVPSYPEWHLVGVASNATIMRSIQAMVVTVMAIGLFGVMLVFVLSIWISRRITRPIKQMGNSMRRFESGQIPDKLAVQASGEIEELVLGFNAMLDAIRSNIDTIYQEQEKKKLAEVTALKFELQSLQHQINPHFLYNTLNIVNYLAMDEQYDEIRSFILSLNQLLRATLSNANENVELEQELALLRAYAHIMEYRYPGMFELHFDVQRDALSCMIPKLILQPLVENALLHGIFPKGDSGDVWIRASRDAAYLRLEIRDNGVGMDQERLKSLYSPTSGFTSVGLKNVNDRLILCFGSDSALRIESIPDEGTTIRFQIPVEQEEA